jgi:NAD+ kinase
MVSSAVLFHNSDKTEARKAIPRLAAWLRKRKVIILPPSSIEKASVAVALGGDGTLLAAARRAAPAGVPVLGINMGRLGYLTAADLSRAEGALSSLLAGRLRVSRRLMLEAQCGARPRRTALNDCVVRGKNLSRVVRLSVRVDGEYLGTFVGDGLIVATPTGSTAYSLAASGPIVQPEMDVLILTPVCSHSLTQRPVVLPADSRVEITLERDRPGGAVVSLDGQPGFDLKPGGNVDIRRADTVFELLTDPSRSSFRVLREKLKWGER